MVDLFGEDDGSWDQSISQWRSGRRVVGVNTGKGGVVAGWLPVASDRWLLAAGKLRGRSAGWKLRPREMGAPLYWQERPVKGEQVVCGGIARYCWERQGWGPSEAEVELAQHRSCFKPTGVSGASSLEKKMQPGPREGGHMRCVDSGDEL